MSDAAITYLIVSHFVVFVLGCLAGVWTEIKNDEVRRRFGR